VSHGNGEKGVGNIFPVVDWFVVEVCPVEVEVFIECAVGSGVGKIYGFFRRHGDEDLNEGEEIGEDMFV